MKHTSFSVDDLSLFSFKYYLLPFFFFFTFFWGGAPGGIGVLCFSVSINSVEKSGYF